MRRSIWLLLVLALTACSVPSVTINVQPAGGSAPTATSGFMPTASVGILYRTSQPPDTVYLPTGPTMTAPPAQARIPTAVATRPPAIANRTSATIGQTIAAWGWGFRCAGVEAPRDGLAWSHVGNRLQAVGTWVVVVFDMTNTQTTPQTVRAEDFIVRDGALHSYKSTAAFGAADYSAFRGGQRLGEPVSPGGVARFFLAFDVSADARDLRIVFTASRPAIDGVEAAFDLGR